MGIPFLGKIPFDPQMVTCGDTGACYQDIHVESEVTKAFAVVAESLAKLV